MTRPLSRSLSDAELAAIRARFEHRHDVRGGHDGDALGYGLREWSETAAADEAALLADATEQRRLMAEVAQAVESVAHALESAAPTPFGPFGGPFAGNPHVYSAMLRALAAQLRGEREETV